MGVMTLSGSSDRAYRIGLIVNPIAGLGGRVGLKGTDGPAIVAQARRLGAVSEAPLRALRALKVLLPLRERCTVFTYPHPMGAREARSLGFRVVLAGHLEGEESTAEDTKAAARALQRQGVDVLLFSGGDGTARDIYEAVGMDIVVVGIPAGVKMHSGVFARTPEAAGELAVRYLEGKVVHTTEAEVMDIDEEAFRDGRVRARLYGYLVTPLDRQRIPGRKVATPPGEQMARQGIATYVIEQMKPDVLYLIGPGTTTRAIMEALGLPSTLLGVDAVRNRRLVGKDLREAEVLKQVRAAGLAAWLVVSPIGGQGHILGRGNQPLSPRVIRLVGRDHLIVVATPGKLASLHGRPLLVDTGDPAVDEELRGYVRVITGYKEEVVLRVE